MKLLFATAAVVVIGVILASFPARFESTQRAKADLIAVREQSRQAAIALCAETGASAFEHLKSGKIVCAGGSGRVSAPLAHPLEQPQ